mgnify:FL=1
MAREVLPQEMQNIRGRKLATCWRLFLGYALTSIVACTTQTPSKNNSNTESFNLDTIAEAMSPNVDTLSAAAGSPSQDTASTLPAQKMKMKEMLSRISSEAIELGDCKYSELQVKSKWIGHDPASEQQIEQLEKRLLIRLPEDFNHVLMLSNGFQSSNTV